MTATLDTPPATSSRRVGAPGARLKRELAATFARLRPAGSWHEHAACRTSDPEAFFETTSADAAKAVCRGCPVIDKCLRWALESQEAHGVWGGLTELERGELTGAQPGSPERRAKALRYATRLAALAHSKEQRMAALKAAQTPAAHSAPQPKKRTVPGALPRSAQVKRRKGCPVAPTTAPIAIYQGDPWINHRIKLAVAPAPLQPGHSDERKPLSEREAEVLDLMAEGLSNKQIGAKLVLSPLSIKTHKVRIAEHLGGCGETSHSVALGYAHGYLRPHPLSPNHLINPTERPLEVLRLLPEGLRNSEIGARLHVSEETVKSHVARLLKIYGARNRAHLVSIAFDTGLFVAILEETEGRP